MESEIARAVSGGRLRGGPLLIRAWRRLRPGASFCILSALCVTAAACGGRTGPRSPAPRENQSIARPLETYQQLGFLAGPGFFPVVAGFSTMAGPADSTFVLFGLSLPNSALRFQRDSVGFFAEYTVALTFVQDSQVVKRVNRREAIQIPTFAETGRTDESVVFQHLATLAPGRYQVTVQAADANSSRGFRVQDTLDVPAYGAGHERLASPVVVYEGKGRAAPDSVPDLILNPRHTVSYGGDAPRIYVEAYGAAAPVPVRLTIYDESNSAVWTARTEIAAGDSALRRALVDLPAGTLPLGKLWVELAPESEPSARVELRTASQAGPRVPLVISISDQWMVANFDEVLEFLEYIGTQPEIDSLRNSLPAERRRLWDDFWALRDPITATPANEYRDDFFQRVRYATEQFSEVGGQPGWRTDRGQVYIVLGPPAFSQDRYVGRQEYVGRPNAIEWLYENLPGGRLNLLFLDRTGFGRYELAPASLAAFRSVAERLKPRPDRR